MVVVFGVFCSVAGGDPELPETGSWPDGWVLVLHPL